MDFAPCTDEELLGTTLAQPEAFGVFYLRHERTLLTFFVRRTSSAELAADLTAEVFACALEGVNGFRGESALAWLFGIARNVLIGSYRQARTVNDARTRLKMPPLVLADDSLDHIQRLADIEDGTEALLLLERLPEEQREAIQERVLNDANYEAIAVKLRCSENVVRQRVSRGLTNLRAQLGPRA